MRHLIVGAGPAGMNAAQTIRALDGDAEIELVCDEPAYARMVLPYYLEGKIEERAVFTADDAWLEAQRVASRRGRVASLDPAAKRVALEDGTQLGYDRLLLATGSRAAEPPIEGLASTGAVPLWTLDDARSYLARPRRHTVIVGAGFIAFTVLDALVRRSERVSFVELEPQVLPNMLDAAAAALVEAQLRDRGIEVRTGARAQRVEAGGDGFRLELAGGETLEGDALVVATGVQPNVELVEGSGIAVGEGPGAGILVDAHLRASAPDVYAAGDVAQGPDLQGGEPRVHAIQPTAVDHGRVAGANMAGEEVAYAGSLVMNILAAQGLEACSFGRWRDDGDVTWLENAGDRIYRKYLWDGDVLSGAILVGPSAAVAGTNDVGMLKGLVQTAVALGPWKAYLEENPLDLRRAFVASGAAQALLDHTLLTGRTSSGGGFRFPPLPARRERSPHHTTLLTGKPG